MDKQAAPGFDNSVTHAPLLGDINNRRFVTAILAGVLGGAGVSSAANLLRSFRDMRQKKKEETDDDTIVLTLPPKAAADGYTSMKDAKTGETKITANGSRQTRDAGKYGKGLANKPESKDAVKCADEGNPGPNTVGTVVANTLGLAAGGLMSYEVVSRIFDKLNERRLKKKLEAAQQAYVNAMTGASKRAEAITKILDPVEHVICKETKEAGLSDIFPDSATNALRYPTAAYILALLAGTGATTYVTKKVLDREFPEEKLKKDINRPTRIVFKTGNEPGLVEGDKGEEKAASAETCAALTAMLPIYMDIVEGQPNRTLAAPYVKMAEAAGTDPAGLMKLAQGNMREAYKVVLKDPKALWALLKESFGSMDFSKANMANILRQARPETYNKAVDAGISAYYADSPVKKFFAKSVANLGGRDWLVNKALGSKTAEAANNSCDLGKQAGVLSRYGELLRGDSPLMRFYNAAQANLKHEQAQFAGIGRKDLADAANKLRVQNVLNKWFSNKDIGKEFRKVLASRIGTGAGIIGASLAAPFAVKAIQEKKEAEATPSKTAEFDVTEYIGNALKDDDKDKGDSHENIDEKAVLSKARTALKGKRSISVQGADPKAKAYVRRNGAAIRKLLERLNAQGAI